MQPGEYTLDISAPGFEPTTIKGIVINGGEAKALGPISLNVSPVHGCAPDEFELPRFAIEPHMFKGGEITGSVVNKNGISIKGVVDLARLP